MLDASNSLRIALLQDFFIFTQTIFEEKTGREFILSKPCSHESHFITLVRELYDVFLLKTKRLIINMPPGWSKSELVKMFICWATAHYPDSNHLYISYSHELAASHTQEIKKTMMMPLYRKLFGIEIQRDTSAKDFFKNQYGGAVAAFGSAGAITGRDAGLPGQDRYSGAVIIDDLHKPNEVHSDSVRERVKRNFFETIVPRCRGINVPIVLIGQRLHEDDICANLLRGEDGHEWKHVTIQALDEADNARYPEVMTKDQLITMRNKSRYVFYSQYQQEPVPSGGCLYQAEDFMQLDDMPDILSTFITADTAETDKTWNDKTVFSFWGMYKVKAGGQEIHGLYAIHWLDCRELQVEPRYLEEEFLQFHADCMQFKVQPKLAIIEKKSTGVTLSSVLKGLQGIKIIGIERTRASGSKSQRFIDMQQYLSSKLVTLPEYGKHTKMCIDHMMKITANNAHRFDDICFVAGTKIATSKGNKSIEDITVNDFIITPFGVRRVLACGQTGVKPVARNVGLVGTSNHPIFYENGFQRLDMINDATKLSHLTWGELVKWRYLKLLFLMEWNIALWGRKDIILASTKTIRNASVLKDCMWRFMSFIRERKLKKAMLFTTRMGILIITALKTWSVYQLGNIWITIRKRVADARQRVKNWLTSKKLESWPRGGIKVMREESGIRKTLKNIMTRYLRSANAFVKVAGLSLKPGAMQDPVQPIGVGPSFTGAPSGTLAQNVLSVTASSKQRSGTQNPEIEKHVQSPAPVPLGDQKVYNLTVDVDHVYYASGVLVSNCDTAYDAIKAALIDKIVIGRTENDGKYSAIAQGMGNHNNRINALRNKAHGS